MVDDGSGIINDAPLTPPGPEMMRKKKLLSTDNTTEEMIVDMTEEVAFVVQQEKNNDAISFQSPPLSPPQQRTTSTDDEEEPPPPAVMMLVMPPLTTATTTTTTATIDTAPAVSVGDAVKELEEKEIIAASSPVVASEESSSSGEEEESSSEEEEENIAPYVAAAAVGATAAAGGAVAAAAVASENNKEVEPDVELGEMMMETASGPPESLEDDIAINPDERGEQFNLADEEYRNEVLPPPQQQQQQQQQDEEQGLQMNGEDDSVAGAPLSPIAEKSAEKDDPSFSSAATPKEAAVVGNNTDERLRRSRDSCCKRHKCLTCFIIIMILFVIAAVVLVVLFLVGPLKQPAPAPQEKETPPPGRCEVVNLGPFYQTECENCSYTTAMDPETGVIARGGEGRDDEMIQFLPNAGTFVPGQNIPYNLHEEIAVFGNYAAFGERNAGNGTVYMYEKDSAGVWNAMPWVTPAMTLNAKGEPGAEFGTAIAFYADKMVVGAPGDVNEGGVSTGAVYVYEQGNEGNWVEEAKLHQNVAGVEHFGSAVALKGDTLAVADSSQFVFVYQYDITTNSWEQASYTLNSEECLPGVGYGLGVTDDRGILVECALEKEGAGAVYYYTPTSDGTGYELSQKITAFNDLSFPELGGKIIVDNDHLLVTTGVEKNGAAFVFELDGGEWKEAALIEAPAGANYFGSNAAFSGEHIFLSYRGNTYSYILKC